MKGKIINNFFIKLLFPQAILKIAISTLLLIILPVIYLLVYKTGGIKYVYSHTMYLPIIIASIFFGLRGGLIIAIAGGVLLGPLMPIDIVSGEEQLFINWIYRLVYFMIIAFMVGAFSDILKKYIKKIKFMTVHNVETGIFNITAMVIEEEILEFFEQDCEILIIAVSWNNYSSIINILGRDVCISILKEIHRKFTEYFPEKLRIIQADFNKLFFCIKGDDDVFYINQIIHLLNKPFLINDVPYYVEFSTGLARYKRDNREITSFQEADIASIYAQKHNIPSMIFNEEQIIIKKNNLLLLGEFPRALKEREIILHYQPKVDLNTKETIGIEALIRWNHPEKGLINPGGFVSLVEESQLIHPLTEFVLEESLNKLEMLQEYNISVPISINISPKNLQNPRFLEQITSILDRHKGVSNFIEFEITESALMSNPEKVVYLLEYLKNYKLILSIDDFGTGYSSLSYLSRFPVDIIKIDKFFVQRLFSQEGITHIVKATIDLAHSLNLKVIAEGIENIENEEKLLSLGCNMGQGFLYSKPLDDEGIVKWFNR